MRRTATANHGHASCLGVGAACDEESRTEHTIFKKPFSSRVVNTHHDGELLVVTHFAQPGWVLEFLHKMLLCQVIDKDCRENSNTRAKYDWHTGNSSLALSA